MAARVDFCTVVGNEEVEIFHDQSHADCHSSVEDSSEPGNKCVICNQPAHGIHFGVSSCRACAAFFRRSIVQNKKYKCRRQTGNCDVAIDERYFCRLCRFEKCIDEGMTDDNVQLNNRAKYGKSKDAFKMIERTPLSCRNLHVTTMKGNTKTPSTSSSVCSSSEDVSLLSEKFKNGLYFMKVVYPPESKTKIFDMSLASQAIHNIFEKFKPKFDYDLSLTALQRQIVAMRYYRRNQKRPPMKVTVIDYEAMAPDWMNGLERVAEWMCHCTEFNGLPMNEKMLLFRTTWFTFQRLEIIEISLELFAEEMFTRRKIAVFDKYYVSERSPKCIPGVFSDSNGDYFRSLETPFEDRMLEIARKVQNVKPSATEMAYMLCQLMWHIEGKSASSTTTERVADEFRERISHELHDYYIHTEKRPGYAGRLMDIMAIVHQIETLVQERAKMQEMTRLFDIANYKFTNADFIDLKVGY